MSASASVPRVSGWTDLHLLSGALVVGWIVLAQGLHREWTILVQYSYGGAVPFLAMYLAWLRWEDRPASEPPKQSKFSRWSVGLWVGWILFLGVAEANPDWRLLHAIRVGAVLAFWFWVVRALGGRKWVKHFLFPLLFALVAVPWPGGVERWMVQTLSSWVATCTVEGLNWTGAPALRHGNVIEMATGFVGVDDACSGVRSFQATLMITLFLGELFRLDWRKRAWLLGAGVGVAFVGNIIRAYTLARVAAAKGNTALENWHDPTGYAVLGLVLAVVAVGAWRLNSRPNFLPTRLPSQTVPTAWRRVVILVLSGLLAAPLGVEAWYRVRGQENVTSPRWVAQWPLDQPGWTPRALKANVRDILQFDSGSAAIWKADAWERWNVFFVRWKPGQSAAQLARSHPPDLCLPASGRQLVRKLEPIRVPVVFGELPLNVYEFQELTGERLWVYQCLWEDGRDPSLIPENAISLTWRTRLTAAWEGRRNRGQRLLLMALTGPRTEQAARDAVFQSLPGWIKTSPE